MCTAHSSTPSAIQAAILSINAAFIAFAQPPAEAPFQISVKVDLVVVHTVVRNHGGGFVTDLKQPDFQVYEDGVRQSIRIFQREDVPVTVGLVIDHSGSMYHKMPEVVEAARTFVRASSPADEMFVVNFNEKVTLGLPPATLFSNRVDELASAISQTAATGQTALYDAILLALDRMHSGSRDKKVLIVISDGGDNRSQHSLNDALKAAEQTSTLIYTIGIFEPEDPDQNPGVLRSLARSTGGEAYFPKHLEAVVADCERIAQDIRHQYEVGYVSSKPSQPGVHRTIRVTAAAPGHGSLIVRARSGYITPSEMEK